MKRRIKICMGSACFIRGNAHHLELIEEYLKEHSLDAKIEFTGSRCDGNCAQGPSIVIDDYPYHNVDSDGLKQILEQNFGK